MTRDEVLRAVQEIVDVPERVTVLVDGLEHADPLVRQTCAIRLGCMGHEAAAARSALSRVASVDDSSPVQSWAAFALARMGDVETAQQSLLALLAADRPEVRCHAAVALAALGPDVPVGVIPSLVEALHDESENVRWAVIWTLGEIGPLADIATAHLENYRTDESPAVRMAAATALRKING